jgi:hypothetical protein
LTDSGPGATLTNGSGSYSYGLQESGDWKSGSLSQSETGQDRYSLLQGFTNVSNAAKGTPGNLDYSPFGMPLSDAPPTELPAQGRISRILANYEKTGFLPADLLDALMTPSDRAALATASNPEARARVLEQIQKAYRPILEAMKPLLANIENRRWLAQNPEMAKILVVPQNPEMEKAIAKGQQLFRTRQLTRLDQDYEKAATGLAWDRLYAVNLEWAKRLYASEYRELAEQFDKIVPWLPVPGTSSMDKVIPGESPEETARLKTEYMLSGRYHPLLNPLAGKQAEREYLAEGLARALPALVMEETVGLAVAPLGKPLGQLMSKIWQKTAPLLSRMAQKMGVSKVAGKVASWFKRAPKNALVPKNATNVVERTAQEVNAPFVEKGWKPPYAANTPVQEFVTAEETVFVRVHGEGNMARSWMMRASDIEGLTAAQIKDKFALPELPKFVSEVHVPAGTNVRVGTVAAQEGWGQGGATQYELLQRLPESAFTNTKPLQ